MSTMVIKLKKTNSLAIFLMVIIILWQGYGLYQGKLMGINMNTYLYTQFISNVIPGTITQEHNKQINILNRFFYGLTDIDLGSYRTLIERNIPLIKNEMLIGSKEDYNTLTGFNKANSQNESAINEDYFDPKDELFITNFEDTINVGKAVTMEQLKNDSYITSKLINFDANLNFENQAMKQIDSIKMAQKRFIINTTTGGPKVLIFHTHPHERFAGEEPSGGGVVDVGAYLKEILETQYGVETLHSTDKFKKTEDYATKDDYSRMEVGIAKILKDNPSIEVAIDIHRDGVDGDKGFTTTVNGKQTAKLMFVNGFCQVQQQGKLTPLDSLPNPYVEDNMALALQMQLKAIEKYPGFTRKTLVKPYRYNLHMRPMSILIEIGNESNTKEEALNTMEVFAELLMEVIEKD
ncbi:MAG TPA: hypothetical protein GX707_14185 [Epulopiscium sp.]|nr:hypothetical protein [Candidatus Epulonipiscium sp.]